MKRVLALVAALSAAPAWAGEAAEIARWGEDSGSLPPEYAWAYSVVFHADGKVVVEYCKGYAQEPPGCATVTRTLSAKELAALTADLAPLLPGLAATPPVMAEDIPVGGGSIDGRVVVDGQDISLYAFPAEGDVERVGAVLKILQAHTPPRLIKKAERRARQP